MFTADDIGVTSDDIVQYEHRAAPAPKLDLDYVQTSLDFHSQLDCQEYYVGANASMLLVLSGLFIYCLPECFSQCLPPVQQNICRRQSSACYGRAIITNSITQSCMIPLTCSIRQSVFFIGGFYNIFTVPLALEICCTTFAGHVCVPSCGALGIRIQVAIY